MDGSITKLDLWLAASMIAFIFGAGLVVAAERAQPGLGRLATVLGDVVAVLRTIAQAMKQPTPAKESWWDAHNRRALAQVDRDLARHELTDEFAVVDEPDSPGDAIEQYWRRDVVHHGRELGGFTVEERHG